MAKLSAEIEEQVDDAVRNAKDPLEENVAVFAGYDRPYDLLILQLKNGQRLAIPREDLQDLADADPEKVNKVELEMFGTSLHWEELNVDFRVEALRQGRYGSEHWTDELEHRRRKNMADALSRTA